MGWSFFVFPVRDDLLGHLPCVNSTRSSSRRLGLAVARKADPADVGPGRAASHAVEHELDRREQLGVARDQHLFVRSRRSELDLHVTVVNPPSPVEVVHGCFEPACSSSISLESTRDLLDQRRFRTSRRGLLSPGGPRARNPAGWARTCLTWAARCDLARAGREAGLSFDVRGLGRTSSAPSSGSGALSRGGLIRIRTLF